MLVGKIGRYTKHSHITWEFSCKFVKKIYKKRFCPAIFSKNFNLQVIPSWVIISYKIYCKKYFIQNILQKKMATISCKFFFIIKFISISYKKKNSNQNW